MKTHVEIDAIIEIDKLNKNNVWKYSIDPFGIKFGIAFVCFRQKHMRLLGINGAICLLRVSEVPISSYIFYIGWLNISSHI